MNAFNLTNGHLKKEGKKIMSQNKSLTVARFNNQLILLEDYNDSIHRGKLYCPFCNPVLPVYNSNKGYFAAWPGKGGHNCGRGQSIYFDVTWAGRRITEVKRNKDNQVEVVVDISDYRNTNVGNQSGLESSSYKGIVQKKKEYPRYGNTKEVFRDVIRSVAQMKRIIEKNTLQSTKNIVFSFKVSREEKLSLDQVVINLNELDRNIHDDKIRFIIFKVDRVILKEQKVYINSLSANGIELTAILTYPSNDNKLKKYEGEFVIGYGKLKYSSQYKKYFLSVSNDYQIDKINKEVGEALFNDVILEKVSIPYKKTKIEGLSKKDESRKLNVEGQSYKRDISNVVQAETISKREDTAKKATIDDFNNAGVDKYISSQNTIRDISTIRDDLNKSKSIVKNQKKPKTLLQKVVEKIKNIRR